MAKLKAKPVRTPSTTGTISKELLRKIAIIAGARGMKKHEALDKFGGPGVDREYRRVIEEGNRELSTGAEG